MNKSKALCYWVVCLTVFVVGILLGENHREKGTFFNSWPDSGLYYGEAVRVNPMSDPEVAHFYNKCKKITVIGLQAVDQDNLAWVFLEGCPWTTKQFLTDTFFQRDLEKVK